MSAHRLPTDLFQAPVEFPDPGTAGTITIERSPCIVNIVTAGAEVRTLSRPGRAGAILLLYARTIVTSCTITPTGGFDQTGGTTIVFSTTGDYAMLMAVETATAGTFAWRLIANSTMANLNGLTATVAEINARDAKASRRVAVTDASTYTVLAANSGKIHVFPDLGQTCTVALPAASDGLEYTFISKALAADASDWRFQVAESGVSFLGGLGFCDVDTDVIGTVFPNGSSNDFMSIVTPSAGTRIHVISDGTNWIVNGQVFSNTTPSFADT